MKGIAWSGEEKIRIVMESLNTNIALAELCRKYNVNSNVFYHWREKFIQGGKSALMSKGIKDANEELSAENQRLKTLIGEMMIANDAFKKIWRATRDEGGEAPSGGQDA